MYAFGFFSNSDCFDHAGQAWDSMDSHNEDASYYRSHGGGMGYKRPYDPLYFHSLYAVTVEHETPAAYLLKSSKGLFWVPKSLCRNRDGDFYIWTRFKPTYLPE